MTAFSTDNSTASVSFASYDTLIWSMTMMKLTGEKKPHTNTRLSATECGLWYCVNSFHSAIKDGNLTETTETLSLERNRASWQPFLSGRISIPPPRTDLQLGGRFNISQNAIYAINDLMNTTFASPLGKERINAFVRTNDTFEPTAMQALYASQDLGATFSTLAKSMTNNIRQNGDNHPLQMGQMGTYMILIKIRPWFLSLAVALITGGIVFLVISMFRTYKSGLAVWGTNALPVVAMGGNLGPILQENNMPISDLEKYSKRKMVRFPLKIPEQQQLHYSNAFIIGQHDSEMLSPLRPKPNPSSSTILVLDEQ